MKLNVLKFTPLALNLNNTPVLFGHSIGRVWGINSPGVGEGRVYQLPCKQSNQLLKNLGLGFFFVKLLLLPVLILYPLVVVFEILVITNA